MYVLLMLLEMDIFLINFINLFTYLRVKANFSAGVIGNFTLLQDEIFRSSSIRFKTYANLSRVNLKYLLNFSSSSMRWLLIKILKKPSFFRFLYISLIFFLVLAYFQSIRSSSSSSFMYFKIIIAIIFLLWICSIFTLSFSMSSE